jgi:crotonyl-CoA carboxylase/reductase
VFEHVGRETFAASCFLAGRMGRIVSCGATSGYQLGFDARHVWLRQKTIIGSHFANAFEANCANQLVVRGAIKPVVQAIFPFEGTAEAHELMAANRHHGKMVVTVDAPADPAELTSGVAMTEPVARFSEAPVPSAS